MVNIDVKAFASKIKDYLINPETYDAKSIDATLNTLNEDIITYESDGETRSIPSQSQIGIRFDYTNELVMLLFERAFNNLSKTQSPDNFSKAVAEAMQTFAHPFKDEDNLCYPHFLLHGITKPKLEEVVDKIEKNARIIHETLKVRDDIQENYGAKKIDENFILTQENGITDDYFGISFKIYGGKSLESHFVTRLAKCSFFLDISNQNIYVLTIQGARFDNLCPSSENDKEKRVQLGEQEYNRIVKILGVAPRRYLLTELMKWGKENKFNRIRVVRPEEHPMSIEKYESFKGGYEKVIRRAGINNRQGCYLEKKL